MMSKYLFALGAVLAGAAAGCALEDDSIDGPDEVEASAVSEVTTTFLPQLLEYYAVTSVASQKVLEMPAGSTAPGLVGQWDDVGAFAWQYWVFERFGSVFTIHNLNSDLCLAVPGGSTAPGTTLSQYTCTGAPTQNWTLLATSGGSWQIKNAGNGQCVDVGGNRTNGSRVVQNPCRAQASQYWKVSPGPRAQPYLGEGDYLRLVPDAHRDWALGSSPENAVYPYVKGSTVPREQVWISHALGGNTFALSNLVPRTDGKIGCLDYAAIDSGGGPAQTGSCNGGARQKWRLGPRFVGGTYPLLNDASPIVPLCLDLDGSNPARTRVCYPNQAQQKFVLEIIPQPH